MVVAGFNTGGYDRFSPVHYSAERRPLKKCDVLAALFRLVMRRDGRRRRCQ